MNTLKKLTDFLAELEASKLHYSLEHNREEAIMVVVALPVERVEINFFVDGSVEIEKFQSLGFSDAEPEELVTFINTYN